MKDGNMTAENKGTSFSSVRTYNRDNTVSQITTSGAGTVTNGYTYYLNGNVKSESDSSSNVTKTYTYNEEDMLASEALSTGKVTAYTYDTKGNRATKTDTQNGISAVTTYTYDGMNRLTSETTSDNVGLLASAYYVYDDNGNLILRSRETVTEGTAQNQTSLSVGSPSVDTFEYNEYGNMTSATVNGVTTTYTYRPDNLREKKIINGVTIRHVWDMDNISMDLDGNYGIVGEYTRGVGLIDCYIPGQGDMFYFHNRHGDVTQVVNDYMMTGTSYDYDAYGNQAEITATDTNPFRYSGEYYDSETGFIYLRNRYYDTTTGRFTTEDPVRDGLNWYAYCDGNPVNYVDPNGYAKMSDNETLKALVSAYTDKHIKIRSRITLLRMIMQQDKTSSFSGLSNEIALLEQELIATEKKADSVRVSYYKLHNQPTPYDVKYSNASLYAPDITSQLNNMMETFESKYGGYNQYYMLPIERESIFVNLVKTGGEVDVKNSAFKEYEYYIYNNELYRRDDIGNIYFGYAGKVFGYSDDFLKFGAGIYQIASGTSDISFMESYFDDPRDAEMIALGISIYNQTH